MITCLWIVGFLVWVSLLAYQRSSLSVYLWGIAAYLLCISSFSNITVAEQSAMWLGFILIAIVLGNPFLRRYLITRPIFSLYKRTKPSISDTEKQALSIGSVGWEGELLAGMPCWETFKNFPAPQLTDEERHFLDNDVNALCAMIDNWEVSQHLQLSETLYDFIKTKGFWGLIIPKKYGGKEFSALAHAEILCKIASKSSAVASVVSVPNSLGPAELLLMYGTDAQKQYYLPRLATGEEIPCFALTSPEAGSDAGAMPDYGIVCQGEWEGESVTGIRLQFDKRYITLAPIATLVGLAFKLYDPDHLLGNQEALGITCALIPVTVSGMILGRRHDPLHCGFPNGPVKGENVFIPLDFIIGGPARIGQGWYMLMERLAVGRAISLPSIAAGSAKVSTFIVSAYARIRRQFNMPIGRFEGVSALLAKMAGYTYMIEALRLFGVSAIDRGEQPTIPSAISKYHTTELARKVVCSAMDISGGKGICMGPSNYIAQSYIEAPIAITVEGANILTRSMIIFGQGVMRCHPYLLKELAAAENQDPKQGMIDFDCAITSHVGHLISNKARAFCLALTGGYCAKVPSSRNAKRYYQHIMRFSAALAYLSDVALAVIGGKFKRQESLLARFGDVLSLLYIASAMLKHYENQGAHQKDELVLDWACQTIFFDIQTALDGVLRNLPHHRWLSIPLRIVIFPWGRRFTPPSDTLTHQVSALLLESSGTRDRLAQGIYRVADGHSFPAFIHEVLVKVIAAEDAEKKLYQAIQKGEVAGMTHEARLRDALSKNILTVDELSLIHAAREGRDKVIAVDDFEA